MLYYPRCGEANGEEAVSA